MNTTPRNRMGPALEAAAREVKLRLHRQHEQAGGIKRCALDQQFG